MADPGSADRSAADRETAARQHAGALRSRHRRIMRFASRAMLQAWWFELLLPRLGLGRLGSRGRDERMRRLAKRFAVLAEDLGGLMIKVGQFLSSRLDVLPPQITRELESLQDEVPAVPFPELAALAATELGMPLDEAFASIDPTPIAAASLGQAHRVRLAPRDQSDTGVRDAVVKILRPGIEDIVAVDLSALRRVARILTRVRAVTRRVDPQSLVEEFETVTHQEIDYQHETRNLARFADDFADDPRVGVPEVIWERSTRRVLTLSDVTAIKINDIDALRAAGIDPAAVAHDFASVMFRQLFGTGFFHADPHPGNVFVTPLEAVGEDVADDGCGRDWTLTFIDFGMMGEVPGELRGGLRHLIIAAAARDDRGLVAALDELGVLMPSADALELRAAVSEVFERFGGMGFAELRQIDERELRDFAGEFGELLRDLPFQLPENFLLIVRAVSMISGVCSSLEPEFNIWSAIEPYANTLLREESGGLVQDIAAQTASFVGTVSRLPGRLDDTLDRLDRGELSVATPRIDRRLARLERLAQRILGAVLFAGLVVAGALTRADDPVLGTTLMIGSGLPLLYAILGGRRG